MNIIQASEHPQLFAPWFKDRSSWSAWFVLLKVLFGLPLDAGEMETYTACTGRSDLPAEINETWLVCGRRAGKSRMLALIAVFLAAFNDWSEFLTPGERGVVMVIASDRKQARVIMRYVSALLNRVPTLKQMIERETTEEIDLDNDITIEIHSASFRSVRGYTLVASLNDEIAFWRSDESTDPDEEILAALRPGLATTKGVLFCASSPYARRGAMWTTYRRHFGQAGSDVLVWKAPTQRMNPRVPQRVIDAAYERDPVAASAEYGAEFRSDIENFITREAVEACVELDRRELPPIDGTKYVAFTDPSGGSSDAMTLAIGHKDGDIVVLDALREVKPPFSPEQVVTDFCDLMKSYNIAEVEGDRYGGEWPRERFRLAGIRYELAEKPRSDIYRDLLPLINSRSAQLLDNSKLVTQLASLERRTARSGRDTIDHAPGSHDDLANAAAGVLVKLAAKPDRLAMWSRL